MRGKSSIILGLFITVALANIVITQEEIEVESLKFLNLQPSMPNFEQYEDYDVYVLSIQWGNTLCLSSDKCKSKIKIIPKNTFTLHGLWPSLSSGAQIPECNPGETILVLDDASDIFKGMEVKWLSYTSDNNVFWTHEYNKHGFCYTNKYKLDDYKNYFQFALDAFNKHELDLLMKKAFGEISGEQSFGVNELTSHLQQVAGGLLFELDCKFSSGKHYLQEVRFFFDLNLEPFGNYPRRSNCNASKPVYVDFE